MSFDELLRISQVFSPSATDQRRKVNKDFRFVHYTTADAAISIIQDKRFWMRNVRSMNDYREVSHGEDLVREAFGSVREEFFRAADECHRGVIQALAEQIDTLRDNIFVNTYVACISEHDGLEEDRHGRLSMWRAYGTGVPCVALVLKADPVRATADVGIFSCPVMYFDRPRLEAEFRQVIANLRSDCEYLRSLDPNTFRLCLFHMFISLLVASKHRGFMEEREWRIIYIDELFQSPIIERVVRSPNRTPQRVYQIIMEDRPDLGIEGITPLALIDRIIVGPSPASLAVRYALEDAGFPHDRIVTSDIPIRTAL
ncbi:DUF2971 domain-containing protein [Shinella sp.]|uniref:DUF2971 domain-containing protein n=1 Tax=Shinella sp. TaxID=1870904 RepID=UPI003F70BEAB